MAFGSQGDLSSTDVRVWSSIQPSYDKALKICSLYLLSFGVPPVPNTGTSVLLQRKISLLSGLLDDVYLGCIATYLLVLSLLEFLTSQQSNLELCFRLCN